MLNRKTHAPLPALCMVALFAIVAIGLSNTQVAGQVACPDHIQGLRIMPEPCPGSGGPCCQPNFRYWGYWPTVWRQWPQLRPDITFPGGVGIEPLPATEGVKPEPLPKEEPYVSPNAPQPGGGFLPPVGEGPATGPGEPEMPFQMEPGFDPGSGFDQGLPGMENLPTQPPMPDTLPIEGTDTPGAEPPAMPPVEAAPAEVPPTIDTTPAMPAPDKGSEAPLPDNSSLLTQRRQAPAVPDEALSAKQPRSDEADQPIENDTDEKRPPTDEPVAPEPMQARSYIESYMNQPAVGKHVSEVEESPVEQVRQTTFESPVEPELKQTQPWQSTNNPADTLATAPPEPEGSHGNHNASAPIGLDGYCPVDLVRNEAWTLGDSRFAVEYKRRVYLLSGPEQHRAFRSNPERYAPANAGNDPVLSYEEDSRQAGRTDACAVFEGRLYMFSGPDSLSRFQANPQRYTRTLQSPQE